MIDRGNYYQWYVKGLFESQCRAYKTNNSIGTLTTNGGAR